MIVDIQRVWLYFIYPKIVIFAKSKYSIRK